MVNTMSTLPERAEIQSGTSPDMKEAADEKISPHCTNPPIFVPTNKMTMQICVNSCTSQATAIQGRASGQGMGLHAVGSLTLED